MKPFLLGEPLAYTCVRDREGDAQHLADLNGAKGGFNKKIHVRLIGRERIAALRMRLHEFHSE